MDSEKTVTACVLIIGNEILSGRIKDANLSYIATGLASVGVQLREARVIPDVTETIVDTVNEMRARYDYLFTTGGIGPTHDDITAECVARAFGVPLIVHPASRRLLESHYKPGELNEARLRMAMVPEGAVLLENPISQAPGFRIGNVHVLPGVPLIMRAIFDAVKPGLAGGDKVHSRTISCSLSEGTIADDLTRLQARYSDLDIGSYPYFRRGGSGTSLVFRGTKPERIDAAVAELEAIIRGFGDVPRQEDTAAMTE
jgi:molybdenum cofactor synthesis domain-containing protein